MLCYLDNEYFLIKSSFLLQIQLFLYFTQLDEGMGGNAISIINTGLGTETRQTLISDYTCYYSLCFLHSLKYLQSINYWCLWLIFKVNHHSRNKILTTLLINKLYRREKLKLKGEKMSIVTFNMTIHAVYNDQLSKER